MRATGIFDVMQNLEAEDKVGDITFGRWPLDKTFLGTCPRTARQIIAVVPWTPLVSSDGV